MSEKENKFEIGSVVRGIVTNATSKAVYLEIEEGVKGVIYLQDFLDKPNNPLYEEYTEGSEFKAQIKSVGVDSKDKNVTVLTLSTKMAKEQADNEERVKALEEKLKLFEEYKANDDIIEAKLVRTTKTGAELSYNNVRLQLSSKNCSLSEEALKKMKGEIIPVIVLFVSVERHFVSVSQIAAEKKQRRLSKEAALAALEVGSVVEGEVATVLEYGAIIKLGLVSGLLHVSELSYMPVKNIKEVLHVGDKINVKVIKKTEDKIGLSVKALSKHPWELLKEEYHVGDVIEGKVEKVISAGLIIHLTDQYSGLMPKNEYSWFSNDKMEVAEGDNITVKVMSFDDKKKRVSLSHKATIENAWAGIKLKKGQIISVKISNILERGANVIYGNVEGFLPLSEVSNTRRVSSVSEMYPQDNELNVMVSDFDPSRARLVVSAKAIEVKKERDSFDNYIKEQEKEDTALKLGDVFKKFEEENEK